MNCDFSSLRNSVTSLLNSAVEIDEQDAFVNLQNPLVDEQEAFVNLRKFQIEGGKVFFCR